MWPDWLAAITFVAENKLPQINYLLSTFYQ